MSDACGAPHSTCRLVFASSEETEIGESTLKVETGLLGQYGECLLMVFEPRSEAPVDSFVDATLDVALPGPKDNQKCVGERIA
jgi:hypothetical protein